MAKLELIQSKLADLLRQCPRSASIVADILDLLASQKAESIGKITKVRNVLGFSVDHTGQLAEKRDARQPFRIDRDSYNKIVAQIGQTPVPYQKIRKGVDKGMPDCVVRMALRFLRHKGVIERARAKYYTKLADLPSAATKAWEEAKQS